MARECWEPCPICSNWRPHEKLIDVLPHLQAAYDEIMKHGHALPRQSEVEGEVYCPKCGSDFVVLRHVNSPPIVEGLSRQSDIAEACELLRYVKRYVWPVDVRDKIDSFLGRHELPQDSLD